METRDKIETSKGPVDCVFLKPRGAKALYVFGHGAGAGFEHVFMTSLADRLAQNKVATLRYQFPYMQASKKRPDHKKTLEETIDQACRKARELAPKLPIFLGGKSMGGRMSGWAMAEEKDYGKAIRGLIYVGYPLHPPGKEGTERADHLDDVKAPMLFLQGTRDKLADLPLVKQVTQRLGKLATLHIVEGADHGFHVLKRSGRTDEEVLAELAQKISDWVDAKK